MEKPDLLITPFPITEASLKKKKCNLYQTKNKTAPPNILLRVQAI